MATNKPKYVRGLALAKQIIAGEPVFDGLPGKVDEEVAIPDSKWAQSELYEWLGSWDLVWLPEKLEWVFVPGSWDASIDPAPEAKQAAAVTVGRNIYDAQHEFELARLKAWNEGRSRNVD